MNILWRGARGPAVKELQSRLKELGFEPGNIDGMFGRLTAAAVAAFQKDENASGSCSPPGVQRD
jgi:peptidoglycan hydrolase-like protein with peptidoglycan-binding domain